MNCRMGKAQCAHHYYKDGHALFCPSYMLYHANKLAVFAAFDFKFNLTIG